MKIFTTKATILKGNIPNMAYGGGNSLGTSFNDYSANIYIAMNNIGTVMSGIAGFVSYDYNITESTSEYVVTTIVKYDDTLNEADMMTWLYWSNSNGQVFVSFFQKQYVIQGNGIGLLLRELKQVASDIMDENNQPLFKHIRIWNNQLDGERNDPNQQLSFPKPALFIELSNTNDIQQMGAGSQIYNDLHIRMHIIHEHYNEYTNGNIFDEDVKVFDIAEALYFAMNKYEPSSAVALVRVSEELDFDHDNMYHFVQEYATNLIDTKKDEPLLGVLAPSPLFIDLSLNINPTYIHQYGS